MSARLFSLWVACAFALFVCACGEGFGRPIVDEDPQNPLQYVMCNNKAVGCEVEVRHIPLTPPPAPLFRLDTCAPGPALSCGTVSNDMSALSGCMLDITLGNGWEDRLHQLQCMSATMTAPAQLSSARFSRLVTRQLELTFVASVPTTIELTGASLVSTRIELRGPITLRFTEGSDLEDVQITQSPGSGASVELLESITSNVSVVGLRGLVRVVRSTLRSTRLFADEVELATSVLTDVDVATRQLFGVELKGKRVALELDTATISGAMFEDLKLQRCGSALFANSGITESVIGPCSENLRIDRSTVSRTVAMGPLESHIVIWTEDTFGPGVPTRLESWTDTLSYSRFCAGMQRFTVATRGSMTCNICDALGASAEQLICAVAEDDRPPEEQVIPDTPDGGSYGVVVGEWYGPRNPSCLALEIPAVCDPQPVDENPF